MVGSGHADCQKASPRYSRSSQRLHWTAVNQKMMQSTAESPSLIREVETRQAGASLPTSARALSTAESRRFRIIYAECINSHGFDLLIIKRSVTEISFCLCDFVYNIHSFDYFTECSIASVKVWSCFVHDKELAST